MIDKEKVAALVGLVQRGKITLEQIKDEEYRAAVAAALEA